MVCRLTMKTIIFLLLILITILTITNILKAEKKKSFVSKIISPVTFVLTEIGILGTNTTIEEK